jgi:hypothetical protein
VFPTAKSSVNLICRERLRNIIAKPLTDLIVTWVIGVVECSEKLRKSWRATTVFRWTTSFTCDACLLKRSVSKQNVFKKKLVLPAVSEIVLVQ